MKIRLTLLKVVPLAVLVSLAAMPSAHAETQSCQRGTQLLQTDAHAWLALDNQIKRLRKNVIKLRTEITDVIDINDDVGEASKTAHDIHTKLSLIAPLFELAPSLQSGLDKTSKAAEITHKKVLDPIHKVTDAIVTKGRLHEIRAEIDTQVLPNIEKYEIETAKAHTKSVTLGNDYIKACHVADTLQKVACVSAANKDIDTAYNLFHEPVYLLNTTLLDTAKLISDANDVMETSLSVSFNPVLGIHGPVVDVSKYVRELEHDIHKLEEYLKKHIHFHVGPLNLKFSIEKLLKE